MTAGQPQDRDERTGAELLREAARLMRERANSATPGPWFVQNMEADEDGGWWWVWRDEARPYYGGILETTARRGDKRLDDILYAAHGIGPTAITDGGNPAQERRDAEHIASWHPGVALAVADLLEQMAWWLDSAKSRQVAEGAPDALAAIRLARVYLAAPVSAGEPKENA